MYWTAVTKPQAIKKVRGKMGGRGFESSHRMSQWGRGAKTM